MFNITYKLKTTFKRHTEYTAKPPLILKRITQNDITFEDLREKEPAKYTLIRKGKNPTFLYH